MKQHIEDYVSKIRILLDNLNKDAIENATKLIETAYRNENFIFIIGNGGSAATASHMANDFSKGIMTKSGKSLKAISLTDNAPILTAISNDEGYEKIFINQLKVLLKREDVVIGISASGNSINVISALKYAKEHGAKTIGLVGFDGGKMKYLVDVCIHITTPAGMYGPVEDMHMILNHIISGYLKNLCKEA